MAFTLTSPDFAPGAEIPAAHTCDGANQSPALAWSGVPAAARSLALIIDDPDAPDPRAPRTVWAHWVLYNLPPADGALPQGATRGALPPEAREGKNDFGRAGYGGPCPPVGRHRYFHRVYALDVVLTDLQPPTRAALLQAMRGHILETAELMGTYQKKG
jgi:Raf kinase inhibitor-like YbhB/YbcL family protein